MHVNLARTSIGGALLATAVAGALFSQGDHQVAAADAAVTIQDFAFMPGTVMVSAGGTVQWTNMQAGVMHTVSADNGSFDSGRLSTGQGFNMTFTSPGSITYHCNVHPTMTGTIVVSAASSGAASPTAAPVAASPTASTGSSGTTGAVAQGRSVSLRAGYNMVGVPAGTALNATSVLAFDPQANGYRDVTADSSLKAGQGYWAFLDADTTLSLPVGSNAPVAVSAAANVWQLVGNPSGTTAALITGADAAWVFDTVTNAYAGATMLQPGQGAWALSSKGGLITVAPGATAAAATPSPTPVPAAAPVAQPAPVVIAPQPVMTPRPNPAPAPNPYPRY